MAIADLPPAGQTITSRSYATYEQNGQQQSALSNEVSLQVLAVFGPSLFPDGTTDAPAATRSAFSGERVTFAYYLGNTGNEDDSFELTASYLAPSDFIPSLCEIHLDLDSDGLIDPGEPAVSTVDAVGPGEMVSLVLEAELPAGLTGGEMAHVDLAARSVGDTSLVDEGNVVRIIARDEARVALSKASDVSVVMPGGEIEFTVSYVNTGERSATDIVLTDLIDGGGNSEGTIYVFGSASATPGGTIEFYDEVSAQWVDVSPPADRVKGVRLLLDGLPAGATGYLTFRVLVPAGYPAGSVSNIAAVGFTGGDGRPYTELSNEVTVVVGRVSSIYLGPVGNPMAEEGGPDDLNILPLNGLDTLCTFRHELLNAGNFVDTLQIALIDSTVIPADWQFMFVDSAGSPLPQLSPFRALVGPVRIGGSPIIGLCLRSTPEGFRVFPGRELPFLIEARSLVEPSSANTMQDVIVKNDLPLIKITQSIREPAALIGDVLSCIITVENIADGTPVDSVVVIEHMSPGLGFAGGDLRPEASGNTLTWNIGRLEPGDRREIVFRARVKAGQEWGVLLNTAWVYGVSELGESTADGPSYASIKIVEGAFTRRGIIMGGVFEDSDGDGTWGSGEFGIAGASVYVEDGTYAVTDSAGLYSIPGVEEGTHVVRVDPSSIPGTLAPGRGDYFALGSSEGRLIFMAPSGNRVVHFPLVRRESGSEGVPEDEAGLQRAAGETGGSEGRATGNEAFHPAPTALASPPRENGSGGEGLLVEGTGPVGESIAGVVETDSAESFDAITIPGSHFKEGSSYLEEIPITKIAALSLWIREHPGWKVFIAGHTDSLPISTPEFPSNFELSVARARSVFQLLRMNGIPEDRMDYMGYGPRRPVATNGTEKGRKRNRRVEIEAVPPEGYEDGDPSLAALLDRPDTTAYSLADDAGICADIVRPEEGRVFHTRGEIDVEIVSPLGSEIELYLNNVPVGAERIGQKRIDIRAGTLEYIFYGVRIREGKNDILVVCREHGGDRNTCIRHVYLAGRTEDIVAELGRVTSPADGRTSPEIVFLVNDAHGLPVRDGLFATVTGPKDLVGGIDVNPHQAGVQAVTTNGRIILKLPPSKDSRRERIHVTLEGKSSACLVQYTSPLHDWFLFGYGEGTLGYGSITGTGETHRSRERYNDGLFAEGRIAFYGQGKIANGNLLTAAVNTRPLRDDMLFRRIEPEKYYPIYGDASELRFNAASRSGTYLRLDNRRYWAMLGDFQTELRETEFTRYHRSFNGLQGESRFDRIGARAFVTRTDQVTYQEEMAAEGTSGFYFLSHYPLIENSEKIRIEVRDRYRPERILRVDNKQTGRDYDINYMDGSILFKEPVPATDENFNPVTIVASYECKNSGEEYFIYGLRTSVEVTDSLSAGVTAILEEEGVENASLVGVDLKGSVCRGLEVVGEYAHSEKFLLGGGDAFKIELRGREGDAVTWGTYYREIDLNFFNPSFSGGKTELGSTKYGGELDWRVNRGFAFRTSGYRRDLSERNEKKSYIDLAGRYHTGLLDGKIGVAGASYSDTREGDHAAVLLLTGLSFDRERTSASIEWDQIISGEEVQEYPNRIEARVSRRISRYIKVVLREEYRTGSRTGTRHLTQLGLESTVTENLHIFSRYRLEGAMSGERGQATIGLKNEFKLSPDLTATLSAEKLATVSGSANDDFLSLAGGGMYTPAQKDYRLKGDYEIRLENDRRKHLAGIAGLKRMSREWSGLVKGDLWFCDEKIEANRVKGSSTIGVSLRPRGLGSVTFLSLVKTSYEKNSPAHPDGVDRELLASFEANYPVGGIWELEGKVAARWVENTFNSHTASASTYLLQGQLIRVIGNRWDIGLVARIVRQCETETTRYGGGIEVGRLLVENLWLGVGYDFGGHEDGDAPVNDFESRGFHVRMRLKFSERLLEYFHGIY
jgi:uncharacterized repeat protein (TIGR01451 family)